MQSGDIGPCFGHSGGVGEFWPFPFFEKLVVCSGLDISDDADEFSDCVKISALFEVPVLSLSSYVKV
ncbi:hypothetical protein [Candidatus Nitrosocosmicus arcticus]|uniref:hypothetical protein n=1 Tax=Candidatus Nitrosocosmicus arcticus TaxID=2035267 RepID=UPI0011A786FF|nr:hypothetical protein [Candidatus Nitrosocosmicus arcticus]